jgi:stearoyl-CoA desaturase (delta-9 desaturase)
MSQRQFSLRDNLLNGGFIAIHLGCLLVLVVGFSWVALAAAVLFYALRMFFITAFYHRYFAHRTYKTSRPFQFLMAFAGASCLQNGPIWWSAHHRHHHRHSDTDQDVHSPIARSFFWAHMGWILSKRFNNFDENSVKDLSRYPELRWVQRFNIVSPQSCSASSCSSVVNCSHRPLRTWGRAGCRC